MAINLFQAYKALENKDYLYFVEFDKGCYPHITKIFPLFVGGCVLYDCKVGRRSIELDQLFLSKEDIYKYVRDKFDTILKSFKSDCEKSNER